jgi:hypothetical protein
MWRHGAITGRVFDDRGEPAVSVEVRAIRVATAGSRRRYTAGGLRGTTDDRGVYRLSNLVPGSYAVVAPATVATVPDSFVTSYLTAMNAGTRPAFEELRRRGTSSQGASGGMPFGDHWLPRPDRGALPALVRADGRLVIHPTAYHPSAASIDRATIITVKSGEESTGADIRQIATTGVRVSGRVEGPEGTSAGLGLRLVPAHAEVIEVETGFETATTVTDAAGRFEFPAVPPGQYTIRGLLTPPLSRPAVQTTLVQTGGMTVVTASSAPASREPVSDEPVYWLDSAVAVGEQPIDDLVLPLVPGARLSGTAVFDGSTLPTRDQIAAISITVRDLDGGRLPFSLQAGRIDEELKFRTPGYRRGRYLANVTGVPTGWFVESMMFEGRDLLDSPATIEHKELANVVLTFTDRPTRVAGTLRFPSAGYVPPSATARVLAFPAEYKAWIANGQPPRRMRQTSGTAGRGWEIRGLPAGDYFFVALSLGYVADLQDPATYEELAALATRVNVSDTEAISRVLTVRGRRTP